MSAQNPLAEWFHLDGTVCVVGHHAETAFCVEGRGPVMVRPVWAEIERLRDLLAHLEWRGPSLSDAGVCPCCDGSSDEGHEHDCSLAAVLYLEESEKEP